MTAALLKGLGKTATLAVLVEELGVGTPAQQLADRFLVGFPAEGALRRPRSKLTLFLSDGASGSTEAARRVADFGLERASELAAALSGADSVLIVPRGAGDKPAGELLEPALKGAPEGARVFVHGVLGSSAREARRIADHAAQRKLTLFAGGYLPFTWRLPPVEVPRDSELDEALIIVVGEPGEAELLGADALLSEVARRRGGEAGVRSVAACGGPAVWKALEARPGMEKLLAAAISRTDTPQGDPVKDGRTQDIFGLGLVPALAGEPRAFFCEHADGLRSAVLVLNGVVADINFAARKKASGEIVSFQLYRPPAPNQHHWSRLSEAVDRFFETGKAPWPVEKSILLAGLLDAFRKAGAQPSPGRGEPIETPELLTPYNV
jgi:hypothetical protein